MNAKIYKETVFHIDEKSKFVLVLPKLLLWLAFPILCLSFLSNLIYLLANNFQNDGTIPDLIASGLGLILAFAIPLQLINQYNSIRTTKEGMYIHVYAFRYYWKFIPWEDVFEIRLSSRWDRSRMPIWVIKVRELTFWHALLSQYYLVGSGPGIVLTSDLENRDILMDIVEKKLSENADRTVKS